MKRERDTDTETQMQGAVEPRMSLRKKRKLDYFTMHRGQDIEAGLVKTDELAKTDGLVKTDASVDATVVPVQQGHTVTEFLDPVKKTDDIPGAADAVLKAPSIQQALAEQVPVEPRNVKPASLVEAPDDQVPVNQPPVTQAQEHVLQQPDQITQDDPPSSPESTLTSLSSMSDPDALPLPPPFPKHPRFGPLNPPKEASIKQYKLITRKLNSNLGKSKEHDKMTWRERQRWWDRELDDDLLVMRWYKQNNGNVDTQRSCM